MQIQPLFLTLPTRLPGFAPTQSQTGAGKPAAKPTEASRATAENEAASLELSAAAELSPEEQEQVDKLKASDSEVRAHEQAHLAAAGPHARGGPTYTYQRGPDGKQYAIGGEVQIDTSPVDGDPQATIAKARQLRAAATAPADPSGQDQRVAAAAAQLESDARAELQQQQQQELTGVSPAANAAGSPTGQAVRSAAAEASSFYQHLLQAYQPPTSTGSFNALA